MTDTVDTELLRREWVLRARPNGRPRATDVELVETTLGEPAPGQVRVRNLVMSVEPYMRGRMGGGASYAEPYELDAPMLAPTVGVVSRSDRPELPVGSLVLHEYGWRTESLVDVTDCRRLRHDDLPAALHLSVLGIPGMTAWVGIDRIAQVRDGDVVFVSSAAGAVGSTAVQLAKQRGAVVIASAGSPEKVALTKELGADAAFDHHDGPAKDLLRTAMAEVGATALDVYFDNVGGEQLEAAIRVLADHARIALCGMISVYNSAAPVPGPSNLLKLIWRRARMEGFLLADHLDAREQFEDEMAGLVRTGRIRPVHTEFSGGIAGAWDAFVGMLDGAATGKALVPLTPST
ncbi:NADP-dependent oxidoreductase, partial [Rhodococcus sp. HM1]|uniref:NADP-dependent oxidoreductase n=1 Tax=unclassified Rhodococcus (in: high G+C Gram-positive bacteria) TaxID=192944 RepID=UPI0018CEC4A2|nr:MULTISPECIES: NADP-dependent oxidoreductase [unclassified Rhodococcus (in: high G+C Gram-positive bacteria)]MBH0121341.1 NADP-dependent oxidoreductase [Rhodococcus sp. CX]MCK8671336.1 NADP-dependent oxidoreductase [Rhodococcus sp. HM1]